MSWTSDRQEDLELMKYLVGQKEAESWVDEAESCQDALAYASWRNQAWARVREVVAEQAWEKTKGDYQAPSVQASVSSEAGSRTNKIMANINDYVRDHHLAARELEEKLVAAYWPAAARLLISPKVVQSGMAALTTILLTLSRIEPKNRKVLVGKRSYFQNRELIGMLGGEISLFDESDVISLEEMVKRESPKACFVDSMTNTAELMIVNLEQIARVVRKASRGKTWLIVDNSMLGPGLDYGKTYRPGIVIWESLNKYHQFGLDRVSGGVIWAPVGMGHQLNAGEIFEVRMHSGIGLGDWEAQVMPRPNRRLMRQYLRRIERNRRIVKQSIEESIVNKAGWKISEAKREGFAGAQLVVDWQGSSEAARERVILKALRLARREKVQLVWGTSFGFPTTRIYQTAKNRKDMRGFLRISVGTEVEEVARRIGVVIGQALPR